MAQKIVRPGVAGGGEFYLGPARPYLHEHEVRTLVSACDYYFCVFITSARVTHPARLVESRTSSVLTRGGVGERGCGQVAECGRQVTQAADDRVYSGPTG